MDINIQPHDFVARRRPDNLFGIVEVIRTGVRPVEGPLERTAAKLRVVQLAADHRSHAWIEDVIGYPHQLDA